MSILLIAIGVICIIFSLVYINKITKEEKDIYDELIHIHHNIKDYYLFIENSLESFEELIDLSLTKFEDFKVNVGANKEEKKECDNSNRDGDIKQLVKKPVTKNDINKTNTLTIEIYDEIVSLNNKGFSVEEIAKKLNKGIREVEIIKKIQDNLYGNN
ncbi:hypothetical protein C3E88_05585 [Clostridium sp. Cult3]|nr:hypothetical protein [Clostridium sp. Cult3]